MIVCGHVSARLDFPSMLKSGMPGLTLPPISRATRTPTNLPSEVRRPVIAGIDRSATCPGPRNPRPVERRFEKCEGGSLPSDASALFPDRSVTCPEPRNVRLGQFGRLERLDKHEGARPDMLSKDRSTTCAEPGNARLHKLERLGHCDKRHGGSEKQEALLTPTPRAAGGTHAGVAQRMGGQQGSSSIQIAGPEPRSRPRDDGGRPPREDSAIQGASSKMNQMEHMCKQVDADAEFIRMLEQEMGITLNPLKPQRARRVARGEAHSARSPPECDLARHDAPMMHELPVM